MGNVFKAKTGQLTCNSCVRFNHCTELNKSAEHLDGCVICKSYEPADDKTKQIEEMAKELHCATNESYVSCRKIARILVKRRGYGDVKQAVKEFADEVVKPIIDELVTLIFDDSNGNCKVEHCDKPDSIQCGDEICIEENKQIWKAKVDKLVDIFAGVKSEKES